MEFENLEFMSRAAEAELFKIQYMDIPCVLKRRKKKSYRNPQLDLSLNQKRTQTESNVLATALLNDINVPTVRLVDYTSFSIVMDYIDGKPLKEHVDSPTVKELFLELGKQVGNLHNLDIVHGDLTTSNVIIKKGEVFLIDFGLAKFSSSLEDKGVDLLVLYRTLLSTHSHIVDTAWSALLDGYTQTSKLSRKEILKRLETIEKRKRYSGH